MHQDAAVEPTNRPGPALTWSLRALPVVTFVITGLVTRSTAAALVALALGWAAALLFARSLVRASPPAPLHRPRPSKVPRRRAAQRFPHPSATSPQPPQSHRREPRGAHAPDPASAPEAPADPQTTRHPDTAAVLTHAEAAVRERDGFLAGWYALVGSTLVPLLYPPGSTGDVRALGAVLDPDSPGHGRELITIAREDVTGIYSYEARGRHTDGGLLALRATRAGRIYAEFHQVQDGEPNDPTMIPRGFTSEKNDNYDRGWLDPADLTGVWDWRSEES